MSDQSTCLIFAHRGAHRDAADDCMDAGGTTQRMEEVEQCKEQLPRAPTVGALDDAGAVAEERKLFRLITCALWVFRPATRLCKATVCH